MGTVGWGTWSAEHVKSVKVKAGIFIDKLDRDDRNTDERVGCVNS